MIQLWSRCQVSTVHRRTWSFHGCSSRTRTVDDSPQLCKGRQRRSRRCTVPWRRLKSPMVIPIQKTEEVSQARYIDKVTGVPVVDSDGAKDYAGTSDAVR